MCYDGLVLEDIVLASRIGYTGYGAMNTKIITIKGQGDVFSPEEELALQEAGEILRDGGLVAFPTETVYGLGGDALTPASARKIYAAKGRPSDNPLIVHIARLEDMDAVAGQVPEAALRLGKAFWPGPLTMVLPRAEKIPVAIL